MSRRDVAPGDHGRWVFNRLAGPYAARPEYPAALLDRLAALAGGPGARVADLGAGTGLVALPLAARGLRVAAVEPAAEMLAALAAVAAPGVTAVHAAAEATGLEAGGFALVVLADALQWIDPARGGAEAGRLLAPGGALAVVTPRPGATPFMQALGARIAAVNPKARPLPPPVGRFFAAAGLPPPAEEVLADATALGPERLDAVLRSLSYVGPALGPAALEALLVDARALAAAHGAVWARELTLSVARRGR